MSTVSLPPQLLNDIRQLIETSRAEYGEQIVSTLARQLETDYGRGFSAKNLRHMLRFSEVFDDRNIVYAVSRQLSWTHLRSLIYIDLLFYNRRLKRLVAIDLKLSDFNAADKGPMELYLRWPAKNEQEPGEASPLGIILCSGKKQEQIELLELDAGGIHVAEYLTELPPKAVLQAKLHEAIARSRARLENRNGDLS